MALETLFKLTPMPPAQPFTSNFFPQVWVLLAIATLSALPWMIIEFKKAQFSVHYQGKHLTLVPYNWFATP